jgi:hypothetical protein
MPGLPALAPGPQLTPGGALTGASVILFFGALFSGDAPLVTIGPDGIPSNNKGEHYPNTIDPRTDQSVHFPNGPLMPVPKTQRVPWTTALRNKFKQEWQDKGLPDPGLSRSHN